MPAPIDSGARLTRVSVGLERAVLWTAALALAFRATLYWRLPAAAPRTVGTGDLLDFALAILLFALSFACAASGVAMSLKAGSQPRVYRPVLVGITTFTLYFFVHPYVPRVL